MAEIIDIDEFKKQIPGYSPALASQFQIESAKMADKAYDLAVKERKHPKFILMCGGSASGKSEFVRTELSKEDAYIFDSTLSSNKSIKARLSKVRKKFAVEVIFVQPQNLLTSFIVFNSRERKFPYEHFLRTHCGARENFLLVLKKYGMIKPRYILSNYYDGDLIFKEISSPNRKELIELFENEQYTEEVIKSIISPLIPFYDQKDTD